MDNVLPDGSVTLTLRCASPRRHDHSRSLMNALNRLWGELVNYLQHREIKVEIRDRMSFSPSRGFAPHTELCPLRRLNERVTNGMLPHQILSKYPHQSEVSSVKGFLTMIWHLEFLRFWTLSIVQYLNKTREHRISETGYVSVLRWEGIQLFSYVP
jgi:hypothetical protein